MRKETLVNMAKLHGILNPEIFTISQLTTKIETISNALDIGTRFVHWVSVSQTKKLGPIPASYASIDHYCSDNCALKGNGCMAQTGRVRIHEQRVTNGGKCRTLMEAMRSVARKAKVVRHRVSGDVFNPDGLNDVAGTVEECKIIEAYGLTNIGFTHSWEYAEVEPLKPWFRASCDSYDQVEMAVALGWGTELTVVKFNDDVVNKIAKIGERLGMELEAVGCPAQKTSNKVDCNMCTLCKITDAQTGSQKTKKYVVVFYTHGNTKAANAALEKLQY